jgi:hypothetical protein
MPPTPERELLVQEVEELTSMMRTEDSFGFLRDRLAADGHDPGGVLFAGLVEDEEGRTFGAVVLPGRTAIDFATEADGTWSVWRTTDDLQELADEYPAVAAAVDLL